MPVLPVVRLPLPNLRTYAIISTFLFTVSVFHVRSWIGSDLTPNSNVNSYFDYLFPNDENEEGRVYLFLRTMIKEPWCLVAFINQAYCCLIIFGKIIQKIVFGRLRVVEQQHAKDKFWNFVFYKFIYIFGVMNVQEVEEIVLWFSWFSVLGFLHILSTLSKDRFEYNSSSPSIPRKAHTKVLALLVYLHLCSWLLLVLSVYFWIHYVSINTFAFMMAESLMLIIKTLYVLVRYNIHLWDATHEGTWENRAVLVYYSDFIFEVSALLVDFCHHLHMLLYGNIFLSMASLVIGMQLRYLFYELRRRIKRHENYRRVVSSMETKFPMASLEELKENDDDCAICWERMDAARRLPCGHVFHNTCLRSWLEQDTTCPTCRLNLRELQKVNTNPQHHPLHIGTPDDLNVGRLVDNSLSQTGTNRIHQNSPPLPQNRHVAAVVGNGRRTSYFHFDGSRILSWLPSFSVEVTQSNLLSNVFGQTSTIDHMVRQVREVFPNYPDIVVREDIRITRSVEMTIDNIVEGRLIIPAGMSEHGRLTSPGTNIGSSMLIDENIINAGNDITLEENYPGTLDTAAALLSDLSADVQEVRLVYATSRNNDDVDSDNENLTSLSHSEGKSSIESGNSEIHHHHASADPAIKGSTDRPDNNQASDCIGMGYRFSKSSTERESMLQLRKKKLIEEARRKYIEKNNCHQPTQSTSKDSNGRATDSNTSRYNSSHQTTSDASIRRRFFSRSSTEGSPVDVVQSSSRNGFFRFINQ